ncbi:helix-turn-helix transcriptional regulator [Boudabousia marimammalium]|uniref:Transcriptional regulator n=1 Tax=Boudabousia marimammalium TaxID=156892 RepID=A0A1Q5PRK6_9ACTO|nr:helix-turn-helix domain-containing protein [Boudabousia marimammalium]OKL50075.1 transcriptional regulator [Boudabousia marimammalium]
MASSGDDVSTRQAVLDLIVEKGPVTAVVLAKILDLTAAAVRRHITALEKNGAIEVLEIPTETSRGRGRPARHYVATKAAHRSLAEDYAELASRALEYMGQVAGRDAINSFAASRSREIERKYAPVVREVGDDPEERARALADALTADGYAATVRKVGNGFAIQLCQGHCPVQNVAHEFPQLCEAETAAFSRLLNVHVQRLATLAGGEHVCTTHVPVGMPTIRKGTRIAAAAASIKEGNR